MKYIYRTINYFCDDYKLDGMGFWRALSVLCLLNVCFLYVMTFLHIKDYADNLTNIQIFSILSFMMCSVGYKYKRYAYLAWLYRLILSGVSLIMFGLASLIFSIVDQSFFTFFLSVGTTFIGITYLYVFSYHNKNGPYGNPFEV